MASKAIGLVSTQVRNLSSASSQMKIKKILIKDNKKFYWSEGDLHTEFGVVKDVNKPIVKTHLNKELISLNASFLDNLEKIKRGPAIILKKDIGFILTNTDINKNSVILEAGTGSAHLTLHLSRFCKKIYSYEKNKNFYEIAKKNIESFKTKNTILKNDLIENSKEENIDIVILDLPNPGEIIPKISKNIKNSAYLVTYLPTTNQLINLLNKLPKNFLHIKTSEIIEREWQTYENRVRPKSQMIAHTAFLSIFRKISQ